MEKVWNYLLSKKQTQKTHFNWAHGAREFPDLGPNQEVFFRSPADDKYIPGTIINKATKPHSYIIEAQGKQYHREHIRPIHPNIPALKIPKQQPLKPTVNTPLLSYIPKYLPQPSLCPPSCIPKPLHLLRHSEVPSANAYPSVRQLLQHLSTLNSLSLSVYPVWLELPSGTWPVPPIHSTQEKIGTEIPCSTSIESSLMSNDSASKSSSSSPIVPATQHPHTYSAQGCPSPIMRQPWATSMEGPRWGHLTMCPSPFPPVVMRSHQPALTLMSRKHQL